MAFPMQIWVLFGMKLSIFPAYQDRQKQAVQCILIDMGHFSVGRAGQGRHACPATRHFRQAGMGRQNFSPPLLGEWEGRRLLGFGRRHHTHTMCGGGGWLFGSLAACCFVPAAAQGGTRTHTHTHTHAASCHILLSSSKSSSSLAP